MLSLGQLQDDFHDIQNDSQSDTEAQPLTAILPRSSFDYRNSDKESKSFFESYSKTIIVVLLFVIFSMATVIVILQQNYPMSQPVLQGEVATRVQTPVNPTIPSTIADSFDENSPKRSETTPAKPPKDSDDSKLSYVEKRRQKRQQELKEIEKKQEQARDEIAQRKKKQQEDTAAADAKSTTPKGKSNDNNIEVPEQYVGHQLIRKQRDIDMNDVEHKDVEHFARPEVGLLPIVGQPRMLSICSHDGTRMDMKTIADRMGFRNDWINLEMITPFWHDFRHEYEVLLSSNLIEAICRTYDLIVVSDNIWGGYVFLKVLNAHKLDCAYKVLLIATNRYDQYLYADAKVKLDQKQMWRETLNNALIRHNWDYPVVAQNNPYESYYMAHHGVKQPPQGVNKPVPIIRSLGVSPIPFNPNAPPIAHPPACVMFMNTVAAPDRKVLRWAQQNGLKSNCKTFQSPYGGPTFIYRHHTAFWYIPYQVSVMKQSEMITAGVISIIPSFQFWLKIHDQVPEFPHLKSAIDDLQKYDNMNEAQIRQMIDMWSPTYAPCTLEFDSWPELEQIIVSKSYLKKEPECHEYGKYYRHAQMALWHNLFQERFPHIPRIPINDEERQSAKKLYNIDM